MEAGGGGEGEVGEAGLEGEGGYGCVGAIGGKWVRGFLDGRGGDAYKPDWVELVVFWRSSRTLESFGICGFSQPCGLWAWWV